MFKYWLSDIHKIYHGLPRILESIDCSQDWELDCWVVVFKGALRGYGFGHCWLVLDGSGYWAAMSKEDAANWI